jgi:hypothetical protein
MTMCDILKDLRWWFQSYQYGSSESVLLFKIISSIKAAPDEQSFEIELSSIDLSGDIDLCNEIFKMWGFAPTDYEIQSGDYLENDKNCGTLFIKVILV